MGIDNNLILLTAPVVKDLLSNALRRRHQSSGQVRGKGGGQEEAQLAGSLVAQRCLYDSRKSLKVVPRTGSVITHLAHSKHGAFLRSRCCWRGL